MILRSTKLITFLVLISSSMTFGQGQPFPNRLQIPDTLSGTTFNLTVAPSKVQFLAGDSTNTYGINQPYLAPTLIFNKGDFLQLNVTNQLPDTTTMHWHGMHVSPADDGGPHSKILPGATWSPDFEVLDEATTFWYHPHLHHKTAQQVYYGAAGMIIVRDEHEASLNLPRTYGIDDIPVIIQDKTFDANNQLIFAAMSDTVMVNGTLAPYVDVPAQMIRLRILNASNQRVYNLGLPPLLDVKMIGSDGGLLRAPIDANRLLLAPGERAELVIDFTGETGSVFRMVAFNSEMPIGISGGPGGPGGGPGNPIDAVDFDVLEFRVGPPAPNGVHSLPTNLNSWTVWQESEAAKTRVKVMTEDTVNIGFYHINYQSFNHSIINDTVTLDDVEIWELYNPTDVAHPFHIHDIQFFVLDLNGMLPPPSMRGRKDVVLLQPGDSIRFITKFTDFADPHIPYMYHCHNLFHEDGGMMGQFLVLDNSTGIDDPELNQAGLLLFPNPVTDELHLRFKEEWANEAVQLKLFDVHGRVVQEQRLDSPSEWTWSVNNLESGMYFLQATTSKQIATKRLIVQE